MDQGVDEGDEDDVPTGDELQSDIRCDRHEGVVEHVQPGDVVVLFPKYEEDGIDEVYEFGEEVKPSTVQVSLFLERYDLSPHGSGRFTGE